MKTKTRVMAAVWVLAAGAAWGQSHEPQEPQPQEAREHEASVSAPPAAVPAQRPADDPGLTSPGTEQQMRDLPGRGTPNDLVYPNKPPAQPRPVVGVPAPEGVNFSVPGRRSYPEGTFISQRRGKIVTTKSGDVVFSPAEPPKGEPGDPPMVLDRCATLEQLQAALAATPEANVTLGGQVFVYQGRHYLLPTTFAIDLTPGQEMRPEGAKESGEPGTARGSGESGGVGVVPGDIATQDLIRDLEAQRGVPRTVDPPVASDAGEAGGAERLAGVANEGTLLVNRRARLIRIAADEGRYGASFDNGAGTDRTRNSAMALLPCAALQRLEALAAYRGENVSFYVSGRVFVYNGKNYLLPTLIQATRPGDIQPLQ